MVGYFDYTVGLVPELGLREGCFLDRCRTVPRCHHLVDWTAELSAGRIEAVHVLADAVEN
jgi:hypothetical protein